MPQRTGQSGLGQPGGVTIGPSGLSELGRWHFPLKNWKMTDWSGSLAVRLKIERTSFSIEAGPLPTAASGFKFIGSRDSW